MNIPWFLFVPLCIPVISQAGTVIFTDAAHPPGNMLPEVKVIYLDAPRRLERERFGNLPANPEAAVLQARAIMASGDFPAWEKELLAAQKGVVLAWSLGVKKIPAVVFDEREVVYGTADVFYANALRTQWKASGGER